MSQRRKQIQDLFVVGHEVELPDATYLWVQVLNPFQRGEAISAAQVARSRIVMALRDDGEELLKIKAKLASEGRDTMMEQLARAKADLKQADFISELEDDPDWSERAKILFETDLANTATPAIPEERKLVDKIASEWFAEIEKRTTNEYDYLMGTYRGLPDDELVAEYADHWMTVRGQIVARDEYQLVELLHGTRMCAATIGDKPDHAACAGHPEKFFLDRDDVRSAPEGLLDLLRDAHNSLAMNSRDPKGSAKPSNSSEPSPSPDALAGSTPSMSTATPSNLPGT